ncbi:MAG: phosphoadenosine phosphosulfate reductase family protein, partial [Oscillospiraceae bacterium]|nr:phosphoadenosine phosphosulfate reductase family protein [Oscillospiraceae bacterium]
MASKMSIQVYKQPLIVTISGGKDSSVITHLAIRAGIPFEAMHSHTTADAPETVYFVRQEFRRLEEMGIKCTINFPVYKGARTSMWNLIPQKLMPPTRLVRYCCSVLKERGGAGRFIVTGVRWAESVKRKNNRGIYETMPSDPSKKIILNNDNDDRRRLFENCRLQSKRACNPIIDWTDSDIWEYVRSENIPINPLYGCDFSRVGCIGCPMADRARKSQFVRYPKYRGMYIRAFDRMLTERKRRGKTAGT